MKFIRILPEARARTSWPLGSSTLNVVLGKASLTRPSTSIASFLAQMSPGFPAPRFQPSNERRTRQTDLPLAPVRLHELT